MEQWGKRRQSLAFGLVVGMSTLFVLFSMVSVGAQEEPIRIDMIGGRSAVLDADDDGRIDIGDRFTGRGSLVDPSTGDPVGTALTDCAATTRIVVAQQRGTWLCTHVLELADGHLVLQGDDPAGDGSYVLAVTGGTGSYANVRGQAGVVDIGDRAELTITLEP